LGPRGAFAGGMGSGGRPRAPGEGRARNACDRPFGRNRVNPGRNARPRLQEVTRSMATEGIRLDDGGSRRSWPLLVPRALLEAYQPLIGPTAAMLWINLYSLAESTGAAGGVTGAAPGAGGLASRALVDK